MTGRIDQNYIEINELKDKQQVVSEVDYDDLLASAGVLGRYQWRLFFSTCPFYAFGVFVYYSQMFITEVSPNHWCRIPELENFTDIERRHLGVPKEENSRFGYSQCRMYDVNWTEILATNKSADETWFTVPCKYGWEFNASEIPYPTIGSELEWVCEKDSYQATAQSIFFIGSFAGGFLFGWISDRYGRISAIILSCLIGCIGGFTSAFARNLIEFSAARFVMGMAYDTSMMMAYLLTLEYIAPKYRTVVTNMAFAVFYYLFVTVLPWIALLCGHWQTIAIATSVPLVVGALAKFFLPESPRWLLSKGRTDEAVQKVVAIGRMNKKEVSIKLIDHFKASIANAKGNQDESCLAIFKRPLVRKTFITICLAYMMATVVFDAVIRNIGQIDFDFFVSFSLLSFTEFPSVLLVAFIMDPLGRRWLYIIFLAVCSLFCFLTIFSSGIVSVIFLVIARFSLNMSYSAVIQWVPEVLPTSVRGKGVAIAHMCGYVGTFISPYIVYLKVYFNWLPLAVTGVLASIAMLIAFALPETALKDMPHTFEDAERLIKNQKLWTLPIIESRRKRQKHVECEGKVNKSFTKEEST